MTKQTRRKFTAEFKAKVALEAIKNQKTLAELSQHFEVNAVMISKWKTDFLTNMAVVFQKESSISDTSDSVDVEKLYAQIGQLKVENDFLKKKLQETGDMNYRKELINPKHPVLSVFYLTVI